MIENNISSMGAIGEYKIENSFHFMVGFTQRRKGAKRQRFSAIVFAPYNLSAFA
jgi:hypothetical protein